MRSFVLLTKALADETRLRILLALCPGEICICQVIELLRLAPSTVSRHVTILYQAGLIDRRKAGKWIYLKLARADASKAVKSALRWVLTELAGSEVCQRDGKRLSAIKAIGLETLCSPHRSADTKASSARGSKRSRK